ncbi:hypothetical protein QWZ10_23665 [Paracoccus cavernae]|uniref:Uncharacterized protein n=1 Tax=Paracoccus cavernae TaxID=1571207 RepID=A0ABT8DB47_9RHOB|nr:hypothetical protein [Paracoccus cavernae]
MRGHAAFAGIAHAVALLGLGEDHRRASLMRLGRRESRVKLAEVMAATLERMDLGIGHMGDEIAGRGVGIKEFRAVVIAVLAAQILILPVHSLGKAAQQDQILVAGKQPVPLRAPKHLDHIPARADEQAFQLLDDLAVAAHRPVQTLQVAVHDESQVVEVFPRGQSQAGNGLGLVHFSITKYPQT